LTRTAVITTGRLELCAARPEDFLPLYESVLSVPEVMRQVMSGQVLREDAAQLFFTEKFDHAGTGQRPGILVERASAQVIGFAGLMPCSVLGASDFEIGFVLARAAWGRGYAQEIGRAQLAFGLSTLGCTRLLAQVSPQNPASMGALEKIGMHLHSTVESEGRGQRHVYVATAAP
jgi:[ribosomal protein S5]-alanine N-acetyltransferase